MDLHIVAFDVGIRNFAYCILDVNVATKERKIRALDVVDLGCAKNNKQGAIDAVIDLLDEMVFTKLDLSRKTVVLIEQQMTAAMKAIQVAINVFFKMTAKYHSMDITSKYLSAKHKLSLRTHYPDFASALENVATNKYKQNKMDGVEFGAWLLKEKLHDEEYYQKMMALKKKDDMADALLEAIYYADCCL